MITEKGKIHIKRYLAGQATGIGRAIALGIGDSAESPNSTSLDYEILRAEVYLVSYDFVNDRLVFKATLPEWVAGSIYEVGLWTEYIDPDRGGFGSRNLVSFNASEFWTNAVYTTSSTRVGESSLSQTANSGMQVTSAASGLLLDFSGNSGADEFKFAFNVTGSYTSEIRYRFLTDASNRYEFTLPAQTAGYHIVSVPKVNAAVTGAPDWASITSIEVQSNASGGTGTVEFDGIRIEDRDGLNPEYLLIAREVPSSHYIKELGRAQDIEFAISVNI